MIVIWIQEFNCKIAAGYQPSPLPPLRRISFLSFTSGLVSIVAGPGKTDNHLVNSSGSGRTVLSFPPSCSSALNSLY